MSITELLGRTEITVIRGVNGSIEKILFATNSGTKVYILDVKTLVATPIYEDVYILTGTNEVI